MSVHPIQSRPVSLMPLCRLLHISGEPILPLDTRHLLLALCHPAPGEQAPAASVPDTRKREPGPQLPLGRVGHAVQPAAHSPTFLTHHVLTTPLPRARRRTELQLTQQRPRGAHPAAAGTAWTARPSARSSEPWPGQRCGLAGSVTGSYDTPMAGSPCDLGQSGPYPWASVSSSAQGRRAMPHVSGFPGPPQSPL